MKKALRYVFLSLFVVLIIPHTLFAMNSDGGGDYDQQIEQIFIKPGAPLQTINENLKIYSNLITIFNNFKEMNINFGTSLLKKVQRGDPLNGDEIYYLRRTITTYYKINEKVLDFAKLYKSDLNTMPRDFSQGVTKIAEIKSHLIYITGHILVLDHLMQMHKIYYETDSNFRRIVKGALLDKVSSANGPSKNLNDLIKMSQYAAEVGDSLEFANQVVLVRQIANDLRKILAQDLESLSLINIITTNPTATTIAQGKSNFKTSYYFFVDVIVDAFNDFTAWLSAIFGNWAGEIYSRHGHLQKNINAKNFIESQLKPMDVLFERTPFVLTDKFIPGYFGHAALYLGTEAQLKAIGMWDHPSLLPYQNDIRQGKTILEAIRSGVQLSTVTSFMDIDTFMMMRKEDGLASPDFLIDGITRGMDQMGKPYDFNFDVETLDKIVCSELIYIIYGNVHWPTKYRLGRSTIAPDDVAEIVFQKGSKFKLKTYINSNSDYLYNVYGIETLAREMGFSMKPGEPGFFRTKTKCFTETSSWGWTTRKCETTYSQDVYEEKI